MPTQITNYQCPACTGPLHFAGDSGKLECDYCGNKYSVEEIEALYAEKDAKAHEAFEKKEQRREESEWDTFALSYDWGADAEGIKVYNCPSCGAELICEETTAATSCPYCGNHSIVPGQLAGILKPDCVIPFKLDKEAAKKALKNHYRRKIFLPNAFKKDNNIEEIKGIYVPFWLFDAFADARCTFAATRSHSHREGDYRVTVTDHYIVRRSGNMEFERVPTDASVKMDDNYMDSIEPFDYSELKDFSSAYLPGYLADKYDVTVEESSERADKRCRNSAVDLLKDDVVGYETVSVTGSNVRLERGKVHYALMPVWTLRTKWKDKEYVFMMNGQTGKLVGDLPISPFKFWAAFAGLSIVSSAVIFFTNIGTMLASAILGY